MPTSISLPITCPCEKEHTFEAHFLVEGAGSTRVQVRCPHPGCPEGARGRMGQDGNADDADWADARGFFYPLRGCFFY